MASDMTPRPEIEITEDEESDEVVEQRRLHLEKCFLMASSLLFDSAFEAWRQVHRIRIGKPTDYASRADYEAALIDPYPYEPEYIFFCLGK
jgi:hypothetical protein